MKNEICLGCKCGWMALAGYDDALQLFDTHNHDNTHHLVHVRRLGVKVSESEFLSLRRDVFRLGQVARYKDFQKAHQEEEMIDDGLGCMRGCWSALKIVAGLVATAAGIWFGIWFVGY